jgi:hypothetical protein
LEGHAAEFPETSSVLTGLDIQGHNRMKAFPSLLRRSVHKTPASPKRSLSGSASLRFALALIAATAITTNAWASGPSISVSVSPDKITNEGQDAAFTLTLSSPASRKIAVNFVMTGLGDNFVLLGNFNSGRVVIPAGQSSGTVALHSLNGETAPSIATVVFNIYGGEHYRVGHPSNATLRIQNLP